MVRNQVAFDVSALNQDNCEANLKALVQFVADAEGRARNIYRSPGVELLAPRATSAEVSSLRRGFFPDAVAESNLECAKVAATVLSEQRAFVRCMTF
jgi:hypothetical protein